MIREHAADGLHTAVWSPPVTLEPVEDGRSLVPALHREGVGKE